jgi:hypothetical protein
MKRLAVLLGGCVGWIGCIAIVVQAFAALFTFKIRAFTVGLPIIILNCVGFWMYYRVYRRRKDNGESSSGYTPSMDFIFVLTPMAIMGCDFVLGLIANSFMH